MRVDFVFLCTDRGGGERRCSWLGEERRVGRKQFVDRAHDEPVSPSGPSFLMCAPDPRDLLLVGRFSFSNATTGFVLFWLGVALAPPFFLCCALVLGAYTPS